MVDIVLHLKYLVLLYWILVLLYYALIFCCLSN